MGGNMARLNELPDAKYGLGVSHILAGFPSQEFNPVRQANGDPVCQDMGYTPPLSRYC